jgi:uncharacterized protein YbjT (DUF2867 family)
VVSQLLASGERVRVFTRDVGKVAHWANRVEIASGDFDKPGTFAPATAGTEAVFLMSGSFDLKAFSRLIANAKAEGAPRIVFLSTTLADLPQLEIGRLHKEKEDAIRESGLPGRFLRGGRFMTNAYQWIGTIKAEGVVYNAMGTGKSAPVAAEDIAAVAVKALTNPDLTGEVFELTGGELLDIPEEVNILSKVLGKPIRSVDVPIEVAVQGMIRAGIPEKIAVTVGQSFELLRRGEEAVIKDTVETVTGNRPMKFETWARKHASRFA